MPVRLEIPDTKKIFNNIYLDRLWNVFCRTRIIFGGSSSGKSKYLSDEKILGIMTGRNCLISRKIGATIDGSVWNELKDSINRLGVSEYITPNATKHTLICSLNDKMVMCIGLDDVEKKKGIRPVNGVWDDVWMEEATECSINDYKQMRKRQRGRSGQPKRFDLSLNPVYQLHWIYKEFFSMLDFQIKESDLKDWDNNTSKRYYRKDNELLILKTIYKDNKFLDKDEIKDLEDETDRYYFDVYTLGNWGILGKKIFKNYRVEDFSDIEHTFDRKWNGLDWGFATDPFAFSSCYFDRKRRKLYICRELYLYGHTNDQSAPMVKSIIDNDRVIADSAEPKSIAEYNSLGVNTRGAKKGKGSIESGIKFLQSLEVIIHPRCINTKTEFDLYQYKQDRSGNTLPIPVDKFNHIIDSIRYATEEEQEGGAKISGILML